MEATVENKSKEVRPGSSWRRLWALMWETPAQRGIVILWPLFLATTIFGFFEKTRGVSAMIGLVGGAWMIVLGTVITKYLISLDWVKGKNDKTVTDDVVKDLDRRVYIGPIIVMVIVWLFIAEIIGFSIYMLINMKGG